MIESQEFCMQRCLHAIFFIICLYYLSGLLEGQGGTNPSFRLFAYFLSMAYRQLSQTLPYLSKD